MECYLLVKVAACLWIKIVWKDNSYFYIGFLALLPICSLLFICNNAKFSLLLCNSSWYSTDSASGCLTGRTIIAVVHLAFIITWELLASLDLIIGNKKKAYWDPWLLLFTTNSKFLLSLYHLYNLFIFSVLPTQSRCTSNTLTSNSWEFANLRCKSL